MIQARFRRRSWALLTAGLLILAVTLSAGVASAQSKSLTVGSKNFSGAQAISQAYGQALEDKGYDISFKDNLGADRDRLHGARERRPRRATPTTRAPCSRTWAVRRPAIRRRRTRPSPAKLTGTDIVASKPAPAVDVNGFYVTKDTAKKYKLKKVSDLTKVAPKLTFGGPPECEERPLCLGDTSQQLYGLEF